MHNTHMIHSILPLSLSHTFDDDSGGLAVYFVSRQWYTATPSHNSIYNISAHRRIHMDIYTFVWNVTQSSSEVAHTHGQRREIEARTMHACTMAAA